MPDFDVDPNDLMSVEEGKIAYLVLTDGNPMENMASRLKPALVKRVTDFLNLHGYMKQLVSTPTQASEVIQIH